MPQLKSREVKDICCSNLRKYFNGEITKLELDIAIKEVEQQLALGEVTVPGLFDQSEISKGG